MSADMHIIAVGARTPVGLRAESAAAAVRAGICRVRYHPFMLSDEGEMLRAALDSRLDPKLRCRERTAALASSAIAEVAEKATRQMPQAKNFHVLLSLPEARPGKARLLRGGCP